jgi:hypothetical protein
MKRSDVNVNAVAGLLNAVDAFKEGSPDFPLSKKIEEITSDIKDGGRILRAVLFLERKLNVKIKMESSFVISIFTSLEKYKKLKQDLDIKLDQYEKEQQKIKMVESSHKAHQIDRYNQALQDAQQHNVAPGVDEEYLGKHKNSTLVPLQTEHDRPKFLSHEDFARLAAEAARADDHKEMIAAQARIAKLVEPSKKGHVTDKEEITLEKACARYMANIVTSKLGFSPKVPDKKEPLAKSSSEYMGVAPKLKDEEATKPPMLPSLAAVAKKLSVAPKSKKNKNDLKE